MQRRTPPVSVREPLLKDAMGAEKNLMKLLKRAQVSKSRAADLARGIKGIASPSTMGGESLRHGLRQRGGSLGVRTAPIQADPIRTGVAGFKHHGNMQRFTEPKGDVTMAATRVPEADLLVSGHEAGHGLQQIERNIPPTRTLPPDPSDLSLNPQMRKGPHPENAQFIAMIEDMRKIARDVPFREPHSPMSKTMTAAEFQIRTGETVSKKRLGAMMKAVRKGSKRPADVSRRNWAFLQRRLEAPIPSHGAEEPLADLFAQLLNPRTRNLLPATAKRRLGKWFPDLFSEQPGVKALASNRFLQRNFDLKP
jgi:hypothetical protein